MHMLTKNWRKSESRILWCVTTATLSFSYEKSLCYPSSDKGSLISDKSSFILYRSFIRAPVGTASDRAPSFLLSRLQQKKERWEEAVHSIDFSHSSRKAWRNINKLTGRSGGSTRVCSASAIPSPHKWWRTGHTRLATASSPDSSTNSCPTYGRFHHLRVTVSPYISGRKVCCCPQTLEARKVSGIGFHLPGVYTPRRVGSQILVLRFPQFPHAPTQNSKDLEKSTCSCVP